MQWTHKAALGFVGGILLSLGLTMAVGQSPTPADPSPARYAVQYVPSQPRSLYFITDNATEQLHIYENGPKGCLLKQVIDLEQVGQPELIATTPEQVAGKVKSEQTRRR